MDHVLGPGLADRHLERADDEVRREGAARAAARSSSAVASWSSCLKVTPGRKDWSAPSSDFSLR
jgi:hypothetical protein